MYLHDIEAKIKKYVFSRSEGVTSGKGSLWLNTYFHNAANKGSDFLLQPLTGITGKDVDDQYHKHLIIIFVNLYIMYRSDIYIKRYGKYFCYHLFECWIW